MPIYESKLVNLIFGDFFMKKLLLSLVSIGLLSNIAYAKKVEQTICQSQNDCAKHYPYSVATIGDKIKLYSGKCNGKTIAQMNKKGWKLTEVIGELQGAFGMVMTREDKFI